MSSITVREILDVHANVQAMQKELVTQAESIRRKDREIELLRWKLRGAEEMCLLARFSEVAFQTFTDHAMMLNRSRIAMGNHFSALQHAAHQTSVASLRGELKMYRDSVRGGDERVATLSEANRSLEESLITHKHTVIALKQRVADLEKEVTTGKLSSYYEEEISSRERLIESLRLHNAQLMDVLKKPTTEGARDLTKETLLTAPHDPSVLVGVKNAKSSPSLSSYLANGGYRPPLSAGNGTAGLHRGAEGAKRPVMSAQGAWSSPR
jgi:hypothetical protein